MSDPYQPIRDYGIIGDLHSAALVSRTGSIDWMCAPRFDSQAVFSRLLDAGRGGYFEVELEAGSLPDSRRYLPGTNILETVISTPHGRVQLTDFMVARERLRRPDDDHILVRRLEALDSALEATVRVKARFNYGLTAPACEIAGDGNRCLTFRDDGFHIHLDGPSDWVTDGETQVQRLKLEPGSPQWILLRYDDERSQHRQHHPEGLLKWTKSFWEDWSRACQYDGPYPTLVRRSSLVLKLLIYAPQGSIVAAPTCSLPEWIGGPRNWDYRYTWIRDSAFLLYALQLLGYHSEAGRFMDWLHHVHTRNPKDFQIMYGIDGRTDLAETELSELEGYRGSRPVRVGNAAADQLQMDIYGEAVDAAYLHVRHGNGNPGPLRTTLMSMLEFVADHWQEPDNGIWEVRGGRRHFLYSKVLCWVALDRGLRLAEQLQLTHPRLEEFNRVRAQIRHTVLTRGWSDKLQAFRQALDEDELDATALMLPMLQFLPAMDHRVRSTVAAIQRDLTDSHGFVYRYRGEDGLAGGEGTFLLCSLWLVDNLALQGQVGPARTLFEQVTAHGNDLGLFSEELNSETGELLGNFPQAFTHLGIINAAAHIERAADNRGPIRGE